MVGLLWDEHALSPVVGVIVMVALTAVLVSTIAVFVFGVTGSVGPTPEADFAFAYDGDAGELIVTHNGGDRIDGDRLYLRGDNIGSVAGNSWVDIESSHTRVITGNAISVSASAEYDVRIVYEDGDNSETLASDEGPAA